jgi:hypothetical protein
MPTTAFGVAMPRVLALYRESIKVVDAKEKSPLEDTRLAFVEGIEADDDGQTTGVGDLRGARAGGVM